MSDFPYMRRYSRLPRSLSLSQMSMVGFGAVISFGLVSGGIFPLSLAGSAAVPVYMAAMAVFLLLMYCMAELTMAGPVPRSFTEAIGRQLGRRAAGFVRAAYFLTVTAIVGTEITFLSPALKPWLGWLPGWVIGLAGLLCLALVIACGAKAFARLEMLLSAIKIGAVVGVLGLGGLAIWRADGPAPMEAGWLQALWHAAPGALWPSFVLATLGFVGIESLSLAARETSAAPHVLRSRLMRVSAWLALMVWVIVAVTGMLLHTGAVPIHLLPTQYLLGLLSQSWAYPLFSLLIAVTVLSVINSQLFGAVRVLHEAARAGELPACLGRLVAGSPRPATAAAFLCAAAVLVAVTYERLKGFEIATAIATVGALCVWGAVFAAAWRFASSGAARRRGRSLKGWPACLGLSIVVLIAVSLPFMDIFASTLWWGGAALLVSGIGMFVSELHRRRHKRALRENRDYRGPMVMQGDLFSDYY